MSWAVIVTTPGGAPRTERFDEHAIDVGRGHDNDLVLGSGTVSRRHLRIAWSADGTCVVTDLQTTSGTFVNGARIAGSALLQPGDKIEVAGFTLEVVPPNNPLEPLRARFAEVIPPAALEVREGVFLSLVTHLAEDERALPSGRERAQTAAAHVFASMPARLTGVNVAAWPDEIAREVCGFGPLEPLFARDDVDEIAVVSHTELRIGRGTTTRAPGFFSSPLALTTVLERLRASPDAPFIFVDTTERTAWTMPVLLRRRSKAKAKATATNVLDEIDAVPPAPAPAPRPKRA